MILKIKSENPQLMDLLYKNPNTDFGLYAKPLKNGVILGHMVSAFQYDVIFQDTKYSYLPEDSNAIDYQSYCNPLVILNMCTELFAHILKHKIDFDATPITWLQTTQGETDRFSCSIEVSTFYIYSSWYRQDTFLLSKYFQGIEVKPLQGRNFALHIKASSVFEAINLLNVVALFTHVTNEYGIYTYIDDSFAEKYARILTNIDKVPYFVFYLFIRRAVRNRSHFNKVKPIFEEYLRKQYLDVNLIYQNTHQARMDYICSCLDNQTPILDIGCGEFLYYKRVMRNGFGKPYFAVDQDPQFEQLAESLRNRLDSDNLVFLQSLNDVPLNQEYQIILTEVIEHNTVSEAKALVVKALSFSFNQLLITTPNIQFNTYYSEDLNSRHDDHQFEFNEMEFKEFIEDCMSQFDHFEVKYDFIGDTINGTQPTQAAYIKKKK